jgi:hypothetical protein
LLATPALGRVTQAFAGDAVEAVAVRAGDYKRFGHPGLLGVANGFNLESTTRFIKIRSKG